MAQHRLSFALAVVLPLLATPPCCGWVIRDEPTPRGQQLRVLQQQALLLGAAGDQSPAPRFAPPLASSRVRKARQRFEALVADREWGEAIDLIESLQAESGDALVPVGTDGGEQPTRFEPVVEVCRRMLVGLPAEALEVYRRRVDDSAHGRLLAALEVLDEPALREIVEETFASSASGEAFLALGELALERGDTAAARRYWRRVSPEVAGPGGLPIGATVALVDPGVSDEALAEAWGAIDRAGDPAVSLPNAATPLATLIARLTVASMRESDHPRAEAELRLLEALAPGATGRVAGRGGPLAATLRSMLAARRGLRNAPGPLAGRLGWSWVEPARRPEGVSVSQSAPLPVNRPAIVLGQPLAAPSLATSAVPPPMAMAADRDDLVVIDQLGVRRFDLSTGSPETIQPPGVGPGESAGRVIDPPRVQVQVGGRRIIRPGRGRRVLAGPAFVEGTLTLKRGVLYARTTQSFLFGQARNINQNRSPVAEKLVGFDLRREAKLVFELTPEEATGRDDCHFVGAPSIRDDRLYAMLRTVGPQPRVLVGCFAVETGRRVWLVDLGVGQLTHGSIDQPITLAGDSAYVATGVGSIAALDAARGSVRWLSLYRRNPFGVPTSRCEVGCRVAGDIVLSSPPDSPDLFALSTTDGTTLWATEKDDPAAMAAGATGGVAVLGGKQLVGFDLLTGRRRFVWPESPRAGIAGKGQATIADGLVFWPTRDTLYRIDPSVGRPTLPPIDLSPVTGAGARLIRAGDRLVAGGDRAVGVLEGAPPLAREPGSPTERQTAGARSVGEQRAGVDPTRLAQGTP